MNRLVRRINGETRNARKEHLCSVRLQSVKNIVQSLFLGDEEDEAIIEEAKST